MAKRNINDFSYLELVERLEQPMKPEIRERILDRLTEINDAELNKKNLPECDYMEYVDMLKQKMSPDQRAKILNRLKQMNDELMFLGVNKAPRQNTNYNNGTEQNNMLSNLSRINELQKTLKK
jgi:hypothetical protein